MEYLQYISTDMENEMCPSFKPYYKWNTFNTRIGKNWDFSVTSFKPYYKWNTFNT